MGSQFTVRRYRPADADRVRELNEAAMRDVGAYVEEVPDDDLDAITATYLDSGGEFLVGTVDDRLVATGAFRPIEGEEYVTEFAPELPPSTIELTRMRVDPDRRRRGYGQRIYDALEARARADGYRHVVLDTMAAQTAARAFYEANGFERTARERIEAFAEPFELLICQKSLSDDA